MTERDTHRSDSRRLAGLALLIVLMAAACGPSGDPASAGLTTEKPHVPIARQPDVSTSTWQQHERFDYANCPAPAQGDGDAVMGPTLAEQSLMITWTDRPVVLQPMSSAPSFDGSNILSRLGDSYIDVSGWSVAVLPDGATAPRFVLLGDFTAPSIDRWAGLAEQPVWIALFSLAFAPDPARPGRTPSWDTAWGADEAMFAVFADGTVAASGIDDISSCGRMRSAAQLLLDYNSITGATETSLGAFLLATRDGGDVTRYFRDHTQFEADHRESVVERNWNSRPLDRRVIDITGSTPRAVLDRHVPATVVLKVPQTWRFTDVSVCTRVAEAWGPECAVLAGATPIGSVSIHAALPKDGSGVEVLLVDAMSVTEADSPMILANLGKWQRPFDLVGEGDALVLEAKDPQLLAAGKTSVIAHLIDSGIALDGGWS